MPRGPRVSARPRRLLVVAAHPDDETLGCGASVARWVGEGSRADLLVLGEGVTSRSARREPLKVRRALSALDRDLRSAARLLGFSSVSHAAFPDNRFDDANLLDIVKAIEAVRDATRPDWVLTHHPGDLNLDHVLVSRAVVTAFRPLAGTHLRRLLSFEVPSSTEFGLPLRGPAFRPNLFVDVSKTLGRKCRAMNRFRSERRRPPHPRSESALRALATLRGAAAGLAVAEAFEILWERA